MAITSRLAWWVRTAVVVAAMTIVPSGAAQTAGMMSFQALLRDANGTPVDGPVAMSLTVVDAGGAVVAGPFAVSASASTGIVSVKYGPVAPSVFNGASRFLRANVTSPALGLLTDVEIVTSPAIAEQVNRPGTGTPAITVRSDGSVAIGVGGPPSGSALDIWGAFRSLNGIISRPNGPTCFNMAGSNGIETWHFGRFQFRNDANSAVLMDITDAGNIGIGATSPNHRLVVNGSIAAEGSGRLFISRATPESDENATSLGFTSAVGGVLTLSNNGSNEIRAGWQSGGSLRFIVNNTADPFTPVVSPTNGLEAMRITSNGRVGIGTASPPTKLAIDGSGNSEVYVNSTTGSALLSLTSNSTGSCVIWSPNDSDDLQIRVGGSDRVSLTSLGRVGIGNPAPTHPLVVGVTGSNSGGNGAHCTTGGNWVSTSDRNVKADFQPIDAAAILERVAAMPISAWRYACEAPGTRHIGPMAQDFHAAFGLGESERHIGMLDADGVALASIQALHREMSTRSSEIENLRSENTELKKRLERLEAAILSQPGKEDSR